MTKSKKLRTLAVLALALVQVFIGLAPANAALSEVGPVDPNSGFPKWYRDNNGLTLDLMEAADPNGISDPVDPANPFSQQIGFNAEGFWFSADASVPTAAGQALLVQAIEAAFAGEAAVDGEQSAFARIRIRVDATDPGTYTVTYPYGQKTYVVDTPGPNAINDTIDIGCFAIPGVFSCSQATPPNFGTALVGEVGPFLTWDTFNTDPALTDPLLINATTGRRYIGTALGGPHTIKGSPTGNNLFRVEGPNIGGPNVNVVETNLFTVTGRLAILPPTVTVDTQTATTASPTITGTVTSDVPATVSVVVGTLTAIDATVTGNTWSATVPTPLANGTYEVVATATNSAGSATDTTTNELTVNTAGPVIPTVTVNTQTAVTATPTITGTVSDPAATVSVTVGTQAPVSATVNPDGTWSATVATSLANGTYEVAASATNAAGTGTDTTTNELVVDVAPLAISNVQVINITDNGATITWATNVPSTGDVQYSTNSRLQRPTTVNDPATGTTHSVTLTGLGASRTIYFRVNATADTQTDQSAIANFKTLRRGSAPQAFVIGNIQVTNITRTSATISWTTPVSTTGSVAVARSASMRNAVTTNDPTSGTTHSITISNLTPNRVNFYQITASDGTNTVKSAVARFRTTR